MNSDASLPPSSEKTILMIGNPNVGKSALFNRLTGGDAIVSNYQGTTVDITCGHLIDRGVHFRIIDVPGTYALEARDRAEDVAVRILNQHPGATALVVLDATKIERGLYLAFQVMEKGFAVIIALNMMDEAREKKIEVDHAELQRILAVPVVPVVAISGEGLRDLIDMIAKARPADIKQVKERAEGREESQEKERRACFGCGGCGR